MAESDDLRRLGDAEWNRGNKEMAARYHERAARAAQAEREREAQKPWSDTVAKFLPVFKRHGFDGNGIDFTSVSPKAIEVMANALTALEREVTDADVQAMLALSIVRKERDTLRAALAKVREALSVYPGAPATVALDRVHAALAAVPAAGDER